MPKTFRRTTKTTSFFSCFRAGMGGMYTKIHCISEWRWQQGGRYSSLTRLVSPGPMHYSPAVQKPQKGGRGKRSSSYSKEQSVPQAGFHLCALSVVFSTSLTCRMIVEKEVFKDCTGLPLGGCAVFAS